ncbi:MAG: AMP-binding protein [Methylococcaceae bacterium]|nr:AMP-binding protein [Methylococcaceae bacterium]
MQTEAFFDDINRSLCYLAQLEIFKDRKIISLSHCALRSNKQLSIAIYNGKIIDNTRFNADVSQLSASLSLIDQQRFAIFYDQAYPFCVSLFALLHCHKKIFITANNTADTAKQLTEQGCLLLGDWKGREVSIKPDQSTDFELRPLRLNQAEVTIYTSGSSGQAKAIHKTLQQFQSEIETLEQYWGNKLGDAQVLATVSHQHIYGLLFRVLWPLASGRCFHSELYLSPEPMLRVANDISAYWVASPAQLKRLDELSPWQQMTQLKIIFSSGGALSLEAAKQIDQQCGHQVLEVYGSSETGGIAWRQHVNNALWTLFNGMSVTINEQGQAYLSSPYLTNAIDSDSALLKNNHQNLYKMDDKILLKDNNQFELLGRLDRIVKIEEKRLSLDELERAISNLDEVEQVYTLLLAEKRDKIACILVLTEKGKQALQQGRSGFIKQIRKQLMQSFETVLLPRKWLFMSSLPLTALGKINREWLVKLLSLDPLRFPQLLQCDYQAQAVELKCRVSADLVYFSGHFPDQPILPGVTQLAWVEQLAKIFFTISAPFLRMEVVKFKKIIQPNDIIKINLSWKAESGKLYFELSSNNDSHSSGRIVYGEQS